MTQTYLNDNHDDHDGFGQTFPPNAPVGAPDPGSPPVKASQVAAILAEPIPPIPMNDFMERWRHALCADHLQDASRRLGVPEGFICEFNPGWIAELGSLALASIDEEGAPYGIEVVGISVPPNVELDRSVIRGVPAGVVPTITPRPGAPLVISCSWTALYKHWQRGANCGWQCLYHGAPETLVAIDRHAERIGASEVIFDSDRLRESPLREIFINLRASFKARHLRRKVK